MYIVAIAWIYVVLMMSIAEHSVIAGIMTFLLYGVLPLTIILYLLGTPSRKRRREQAETSVSPENTADQAEKNLAENLPDPSPPNDSAPKS